MASDHVPPHQRRRRPRPAPRVTVALSLLAALGLLASPATTPGASAAAAPHASGLPWASGVSAPGRSVTATDEFAVWRGRPVDVVVDFTGRSTWQDVSSPAWLLQKWRDTPVRTVVLSVAMLPDEPSATMGTCAAGQDDARWSELGRHLAASGLAQKVVVRLGWEMNGNWQKWSATDPEAFVACWRRVHDAVEAQAPQVRWEWEVNRGVGQGLADARRAYPGDAYVDVVGVSSYDVFPAVVDEATWRRHWDGQYGLNFWTDFAVSHSKPVAVSEWGLYPGWGNTGPNGGDNAYYVAKMQAWFAAVAPHLAYEAYFNEPAEYIQGSLSGPGQNPSAADAYRAGLAAR